MGCHAGIVRMRLAGAQKESAGESDTLKIVGHLLHHREHPLFPLRMPRHQCGGEELLTIGEVLIEGARRHIGVRGYLLDRGARPNAPQELNGGVEDVRSGAGERSVLPPLLRGLLPRGLGSRSRCCHGLQCTRRGGLSIDTLRIEEYSSDIRHPVCRHVWRPHERPPPA